MTGPDLIDRAALLESLTATAALVAKQGAVGLPGNRSAARIHRNADALIGLTIAAELIKQAPSISGATT